MVGLSIGAFAAINAAGRLPEVEGLVLESPYPTFDAWYRHARGARSLGRLNRAMARLWPRTYRRIDAGANAAHVRAKRILVAASADDEITPARLSWQVADALPADRTQRLEVPGRHLQLFADAEYRAAILATLGARRPSEPTSPAAPQVKLISPLG